MKKTNLRKSKGITLIALVITIIVLLILAGVAISMLSGENGILKKATEAKTKTEEGQKREETALSSMELETHFQTENSKYKCGYGIITGITITTSDGSKNVKDKVENLQKDLPSGYEIYNGNTKANNNDIIVTGMTVKKDGKEVAMVVVYGDVDGDGYIGSPDALEITQYIQGVENSIPDYKKIAMDINNDGIISKEDSEKILNIEAQGVNGIYGKDEYYQNEYAKDPNSIKISNE